MKYLIVLFYLMISTTYADNREKVLIVDTGISSKWVDKKYLCKDGEKTMFSTSEDNHGHGSNVYGLLTKDMDITKHCVVSLRIYDDKGKCSDATCFGALRFALDVIKKDKQIKHLNLSMAGTGRGEDEDLVKEILKRGGYVTVAAGNTSKNLTNECDIFPACYKKTIKNDNFRVVGNAGASSTNTGDVVTDAEFAYRVGNPAMTGTSQASAILMSKLLKNR